jgi:DNA-binding transcriptional ArsR family regulator
MTLGRTPWRCAVTPRFELFFALWSLSAPAARRHPSWRAHTRARLSPAFWNAQARMGDCPELWIVLADIPGTLGPRCRIEDVLERLRAVPPAEFKRRTLAAVLHDPAAIAAVMSGRSLTASLKAIPRAKRDWLQFMGLYPPQADAPAQRAIERLLKTPAAVRDASVDAALIFWRESFDETWRRLVPRFAASLARARAMVDRGDWDGVSRLGLNVEVDRHAGELKALRGGYRLPIRDALAIYLLPSAFNEGKFWTVLEARGGRQVAYLPYLDATVTPDPEPFGREVEAEADVALVFRALGDATRFAMASLIAQGPVSATDLARSLGLSKPTISHHLHELREARLIEEKDEGKSVLLSLNRRTIASLSRLALARLKNPVVSLPTGRTRPQRARR